VDCIMTNLTTLSSYSINLLKQLIAIPSFSKEEDKTADLIEFALQEHGVSPRRVGNNVIAYNKYFVEGKPTILLNSHHDTVKPNPAYSRDPFLPAEEEGKLYGLGSRSEEHTSELQSRENLVCRLL